MSDGKLAMTFWQRHHVTIRVSVEKKYSCITFKLFIYWPLILEDKL